VSLCTEGTVKFVLDGSYGVQTTGNLQLLPKLAMLEQADLSRAPDFHNLKQALHPLPALRCAFSVTRLVVVVVATVEQQGSRTCLLS
jgi:hypothetical protein